jgi:transposase
MAQFSVEIMRLPGSLLGGNQHMIRTKTASDLPSWIDKAGISLVASFARGVINDEKAVRAAMTSSWSNGQTEGQITRLKLVKRQMYGRGKIDLLQARLIGAP